MTIQINTDKNVKATELMVNKYTELLQTKLNRFSEFVTSLQVYLSDVNNNKDGVNDKKCSIEVRIKGQRPDAVTAEGTTVDHAINEAIDKLRRMLDSKVGQMQNH